MSVYKPKTSRIWLYDFILKGERFCGSTGQTSRRAAETIERQKRLEAASGELGAVAKMTLDQAAGRWWREVGIRRGDAVDVERRIETLLRILGGAKLLCKIGQAEIAAAIETRRGETYRKSNKPKAKFYPVSNSTVNRDIIETFRPIHMRARSHWTPTGTAHGLPDIDWRKLRLREPRALNRTYSPAEREAWLNACPGETERLALDLLLTNGLRFGELFFAPDLLKADMAVLTLQKGRKRDVLLDAHLREDMARDLAARASRAIAASLPHLWYDEGPCGKLIPITYGAMEYRISHAADVAGITGKRRIHGARHHTGSTIHSRSGGDLKAVQAVLGHASITSSARYSQVPPDRLRSIMFDDESRYSPEVGIPTTPESQAG